MLITCSPWLNGKRSSWLVFSLDPNDDDPPDPEISRPIIEAVSEITDEDEVRQKQQLVSSDARFELSVELSSLYHTIDYDEEVDDLSGKAHVRRLQRGGPLDFEISQSTTYDLLRSLFLHGDDREWVLFKTLKCVSPLSFRVLDEQLLALHKDLKSSKESFADPFPTNRFDSPTLPQDAALTADQLTHLFSQLDNRITYSQMYKTLDCKPSALKEHLRAAHIPLPTILTRTSFSVSELVDRLVPYLQNLDVQGSVVFQLLSWFSKAGLITSHRPKDRP